MSKRLKRWVYGLVIAFLLFGLTRLYYHLTDDFRLSNITYQLPFEAPWQVPILTDEEYEQLARILNQKFSYLGKGAQCYAFVSEDQQYVLKFFKFKHLKPNLIVDLLPSVAPFKSFKQNCIEHKRRKLIGVFNGYDLAYRENRQDSELLYLHLHATNNLNLQATIVDKMGFERRINLDSVVFLVQRKGETLRNRLNRLLKQERLQEAEQAISSVLVMYMSEYKKGIFDRDHGVLHNTGFIGNQPFHLDVGKLNKDERIRQLDVYKKDLEHVVWRMDVWVKATYPHYYPQLSDFLASEYQKWTGEVVNIKAIDPKQFKKRR
jgi:hypothetical protein